MKENIKELFHGDEKEVKRTAREFEMQKNCLDC